MLHIAKVGGFDLVRTGKHYDGGYIMLDDFHAGDIAYSFGICDDVSWDKDMASRGYDIFMYDHTIDMIILVFTGQNWALLTAILRTTD